MPDGHIGRMVVLSAWRGKGLGQKILGLLLDAARHEGHAKVELSSQQMASNFYRKQGFVQLGEPYQEAGRLHVAMQLKLETEQGVPTE